MKNTKRFIAMIMLVVVVFGTMSFASAAVWRTGDFRGSIWTSYHYVYSANQNNWSDVYFHTYACAKGTGHSGACQSITIPSGKVSYQVYNSKGALIVSATYNAQGLGYISFRGPYISVRFSGSGNKYQHWGIEGRTNVRSIS